VTIAIRSLIPRSIAHLARAPRTHVASVPNEVQRGIGQNRHVRRHACDLNFTPRLINTAHRGLREGHAAFRTGHPRTDAGSTRWLASIHRAHPGWHHGPAGSDYGGQHAVAR